MERVNKTKDVIYFVILLGVVSLFSDITYEAARSITGPYLSILGASALVVGFAAGLGEFLGYGLRLLSGFLVDKSKRYWEFIFLGYSINLFAVPLLGLVNQWEFAVLLLLLERTGKALRTPPRDTLLSFATVKMGRGLGFGIHEAMDQIGAVTGPLLVALILYYRDSYKEAFLVLLIPALLALLSLILAKRVYPVNVSLTKEPLSLETKGFSPAFWWYLLAMSLIGVGFVNYALIGYHLSKNPLLVKETIPLLYALAMGVDAIAALILGILYDKQGMKVVLFSILISLASVPLIFLSGLSGIIVGIILWGIGMGAQESVLRAIVAQLVPKEKRASGYGVFHSLFGLASFGGSFLLGFLYDYSLIAMLSFSVIAQTLSLPIIVKVIKLCRSV